MPSGFLNLQVVVKTLQKLSRYKKQNVIVEKRLDVLKKKFFIWLHSQLYVIADSKYCTKILEYVAKYFKQRYSKIKIPRVCLRFQVH